MRIKDVINEATKTGKQNYNQPLTRLWFAFYDASSMADYFTNAGREEGKSPKPYIRRVEKIYARVVKEHGEPVAKFMSKWAVAAYERFFYNRGWSEKKLFQTLKKAGVDPHYQDQIDWSVS